MKKGLIAVLIILVVAVASIVGANNKLVKLDENVNEAYSNIQTTVQRRADLIPNLVETVKGYSNEEKEIFANIAKARAGITSASSPKQLAQANDELTRALSGINVIVEAYPDLKASKNFQSLQDELAGTENRISVARKDYNQFVKDYNAKIRSFPISILASFRGFKAREYFEASPTSQEVPKVDFK